MGKDKKTQSATVPPAKKTRWQRVVVLGIAAKEGWDELTPGQYLHIKDLVKQLVGFGRRQYDSNLTIAPFGDFWELKEKGGTLGRKNMRVYFRFHQEKNDVVILQTYKKEDDGKAPPHIHKRLKNRWLHYLNGGFDGNTIKYKRPE